MSKLSPLTIKAGESWFRKMFGGKISSRHVERGIELDMDCPFCKGGHSGDRDTFNYNVTTGIGRCWRASCGWRGNIYTFVMAYEGIGFKEAKEVLEGSGDAQTLQRALKASLEALVPPPLFSTSLAEVTILAWDEEWEPIEESGSYSRFCEWIVQERGFDVAWFEQTFPTFEPQQEYVRNEGRVAFKIESDGGIGYLLYSMDHTAVRKTLNPPGQILSHLLGNYDLCREDPKPVFLCEGFFDAARMMERGYNACVLFGVSVSPHQAALIDRMASDNIIVLLDNGAEEQTMKIAEALNQYTTKTIWVATIPFKGMDPDDLSEEQLQQVLNKMVPLDKPGREITFEPRGRVVRPF